MTTTTRKRWTEEENAYLMREMAKNQPKKVSYLSVAEHTGRTANSVAQHYLLMLKESPIEPLPTPEPQEETPRVRPWTKEEDDTLLRYIIAGVSNLNQCFIMVAEQINRTPAAVGSHWYQVLSKRPDVQAFFTASSNHVSMNRKNGAGVPCTRSIWRRLLAVLRSL